MIGNYKQFSSGFFDVVVADECHRSIYGVWQKALTHFDAFHIGLTATPSEFIQRNTFRFYQCKDNTPDFHYDMKKAFKEKYLIPYTFSKSITKILTEGVDAEGIHYNPSEYYRKFVNKDTDEKMMREFDEEAWQVYKEIAPDQSPGPGKTIIFAINKRHAARLAQILNGRHPELKGRYAEVITSDVKGVDDVIRRFKREDYPQIAVSVGMLDTGFDCPEVIHLVMARPIRSPILYQQMRGRGTRRADQIGKNRFMIYDFFGNHDYFNDSDADPFAGAGGYIGKEGEGGKKYKERILLELDIEDEWIYRGKTIDYGPDGEEIDKNDYITNWEKAITGNFATDPLVQKIREGEDLSEGEEEILSVSLNQPELYFNEQNLRRAYAQPLGSLADFIKHAQGLKKLKSTEEQIEENFDAWVITQNLKPEQTDFMRLLKNRFIANGRATVDDLFVPPLSQLNAARKGVELFGEERLLVIIEDLNTTIFERMKSIT
jgi:type I restriction enzyme R subunit